MELTTNARYYERYDGEYIPVLNEAKDNDIAIDLTNYYVIYEKDDGSRYAVQRLDI